MTLLRRAGALNILECGQRGIRVLADPGGENSGKRLPTAMVFGQQEGGGEGTLGIRAGPR